jgi:hypothetical protein
LHFYTGIVRQARHFFHHSRDLGLRIQRFERPLKKANKPPGEMDIRIEQT